MPGAQGPSVLLCLLFLLLLSSHSTEGSSSPLPPWRRFEYKLSFKGPRLAWPEAGIPFWTHHGDAIPGLEEVGLAPSLRNRSGAVWSRALVPFPTWEVETQMWVTGPGRWGTQGMVVWYTLDGDLVGSVPPWLASRDGVGIFFDSSAEGTRNSPAIRVLASDGHRPHEQLGNGGSRVLGSCHWDFRNQPYPFRARITYWRQRLRMSPPAPEVPVSLSSGFTPSDPEVVCVDVGPLLLTPGGYFGVSAATGTLADNHDVLSFLTFSLSEPGAEVPPGPFLETEQLRLAGLLEELQAKLGLGSRRNTHPQPNARAQEGGERLFDMQETLSRHSRILQAIWNLSEHVARVKKQWKQQLGSPGWARTEDQDTFLPDPICSKKGSYFSRPLNMAETQNCEGALVLWESPWKEEGCSIPKECDPEKVNPGPEAALQDSAKVSTLLCGQQTLLQGLQEMRDVAARMALEAQVVSLPVGIKHHFLELDQILSLLHKDLQGTRVTVEEGGHWAPLPEKAAAKGARDPGWRPGNPACLRPGVFLLFLLIQAAGFFYYVNFSRQKLDKRLQESWSLGSLSLSPAPDFPSMLGAPRRQPFSCSTHA